jgi:hypothetical protein
MRLLEIVVEPLIVGSRAIPVDWHEIDLAPVARGYEFLEPGQAAWAVGDGWYALTAACGERQDWPWPQPSGSLKARRCPAPWESAASALANYWILC